MVTFFIFLSTILVLYVGVESCFYVIFQEKTSFSLTFNQFLKFYMAAPKKYLLSDVGISYGDCAPYNLAKIGMKTIVDYIRYQAWFRKFSQCQNLQDYVNCVHKDLNNYYC